MSNYSRDQVKEMIVSVMEKASSPQAETLQNIYEELSSLTSIIDDMYSDIVATRSLDVAEKHIPTATDELDAVVGATEKASASIMDAAEAIQSTADGLDDETKGRIFNETTKIFEACSFQDITGQRITKVVTTLKDIEIAVDKLLDLFGPFDREGTQQTDEIKPGAVDESLMNGPQLPGQAISQDDIDKLLAEFD